MGLFFKLLGILVSRQWINVDEKPLAVVDEKPLAVVDEKPLAVVDINVPIASNHLKIRKSVKYMCLRNILINIKSMSLVMLTFVPIAVNRFNIWMNLKNIH
jgi:hypothetical protein